MPATRHSTLVTDDGAHLAVYTDGDPNAPKTILLSHGFLMTSDVWRIQTRELANRGHRVVRCDHRGHGNSTTGATTPTLQRLGADLAHVLTATAADGPLVLAGHSMGGMTVMSLAAAQPDLISARRPRVALVSTSCSKVILKPHNRPVGWSKGLYRGGLARSICLAPPFTDRVRSRLPRQQPWALRTDGAPVSNTPPAGRQAIHHTPTTHIASLWKSMRTFDLAANLRSLNNLADRVEIITGADDDWIPISKTHELSRCLPDALLHPPVPGAGHRLPTDRQGHEAVTKLLSRMCESAEQAERAPAADHPRALAG